MDQRRPVYEQLATLTVTTDDAEPAAVVERILAALPSAPPGAPSRAGGPGAGEPR
jgi:shikimate kinase